MIIDKKFLNFLRNFFCAIDKYEFYSEIDVVLAVFN